MMASSRSAALGVDDVGERLRCLGNHRQLARQNVGALLELVFVLQPRVEPLQTGPLPQHVGLFVDRHQPGDALLDQERIADVLEDRPAAAGPAPALGKLPRQRLDHVEHLGDVTFVVREDHAGGERIRDQQGVLVGQALQRDRAAWQDQLILVGSDLDPRRTLPRAAWPA